MVIWLSPELLGPPVWTDANGTWKFSAFSPEWAPESDLITPVLRVQQRLLFYILILKNQVLIVPGRPIHTHTYVIRCFLLLYPGAIPTWNKEALPLPACRTPPGHVPSSPSLLRRPFSVEPDLVLCLRGPPSPLPALLQRLSPCPSLSFKSFS